MDNDISSEEELDICSENVTSLAITDKLNSYEIKPKFINILDLLQKNSNDIVKNSNEIVKNDSLIEENPNPPPQKSTDIRISSQNIANVNNDLESLNKVETFDSNPVNIYDSNPFNVDSVMSENNSRDNSCKKTILKKRSIIGTEALNSSKLGDKNKKKVNF